MILTQENRRDRRKKEDSMTTSQVKVKEKHGPGAELGTSQAGVWRRYACLTWALRGYVTF
jgi:hypothetical protein